MENNPPGALVLLRFPEAATLDRRPELPGCRMERLPSTSRRLTFYDSFEWGIWFGKCLLYVEGRVHHLCALLAGGIGQELCAETATAKSPRFAWDFQTPAMRSNLDELLGLRSLVPVGSAHFRTSVAEFRNAEGKVVSRLEETEITMGKHREHLRYGRILGLRGYESESAALETALRGLEAVEPSEGPIEAMLHCLGNTPRHYTLRPVFGVERGTPARQAVDGIIRTMLGLARSNEEGIRSDTDTEFLHDYRICVRKVRSLLSLLKETHPPQETSRLRENLATLARRTNRLRDLDVYLLAKGEYTNMLPCALHVGLDAMFADFQARRTSEARRVSSQLRSPAYHRQIREIEQYFGEASVHPTSKNEHVPVGALVYERIRKRYNKIRKIARRVDADTSESAMHDLRIECKKLRYLMEFFEEMIPPGLSVVLEKPLRRLQARLGEFNDCSVQRAFLTDYWQHRKTKSGDQSEIALSLGGLVSVLHYRQSQMHGGIRKTLEDFCGDEISGLVKKLFAPTTPE